MTQSQRYSTLVNIGVATAILVIVSGTAHAYCTLPKTAYAFTDTNQCSVDKEISVYINTGERSIARTGLALDDIERFVRASIAAYNEKWSRAPATCLWRPRDT